MIVGNHVVLRPLAIDDTDLIVRWRNAPSVRENFVYREELTAEKHAEYFETKVKTGRIAQFIIIAKESGAPIGSVYLRDIDHENDKAEFGIFIGEALQRGRGYGREAAQLICSYGFRELSLHKITLRVFPFNKAAIKAYENVGFRQEAYFRDDVRISGRYEDMIHMALFEDGMCLPHLTGQE